MFQKAGIMLDTDMYKEIPYIKVNSIRFYNKEKDKISSLLGSPWAATEKSDDPYLVQYGYFSNPAELEKLQCPYYVITLLG